jgi:hypothetical protein
MDMDGHVACGHGPPGGPMTNDGHRTDVGCRMCPTRPRKRPALKPEPDACPGGPQSAGFGRGRTGHLVDSVRCSHTSDDARTLEEGEMNSHE